MPASSSHLDLSPGRGSIRAMAKRSSSPPLYELIRPHGSTVGDPAAADRRESGVGDHGLRAGNGGSDNRHSVRDSGLESSAPLPLSWLRPGRTLHLPMGYIFVSAAAALLLVMGSYMIGFSRGKAMQRYVQGEEAEAYLASGAGAAAVPRDPLERPAQPALARENPLSSTQPSASRSRQEWGPVYSDPRQPGLHYLFLLTTNRSGAERFVEFAREHGLETYIIPENNRYFVVFALPGFESHTSPEAEAFREEVLKVGRVWKERERARDNPVAMSIWRRYGPRQ